MFFVSLLLVLQLNNGMEATAQEDSYDCNKDDDEMTLKVRKAAVVVHNKWRNYITVGKARKAPDFSQRYPTAADMLAMTYNCTLEEKAREQNLCNRIFPRSSFTKTDQNYDYITYKSHITEEGAMIMVSRKQTSIGSRLAQLKDCAIWAGHNWWDRYLYTQGMKEVTPVENDFATLPFFIMVKASTPTVGCAVQLCKNINPNDFCAVFCYYGEPHVKAYEPLYEQGEPCSRCPPGYKCKGEKRLCRKE